METIALSAKQTDGSSQHAFGIPHTFSMASCWSFTPALVRDVIMQVGHCTRLTKNILFAVSSTLSNWYAPTTNKFTSNIFCYILFLHAHWEPYCYEMINCLLDCTQLTKIFTMFQNLIWIAFINNYYNLLIWCVNVYGEECYKREISICLHYSSSGTRVYTKTWHITT